MRTRTKLLLAAGAATMLSLGGLAGLAQADMPGGPGGSCGMRHGFGMMGPGMMGWGMMGQQMMDRYDANKDGKITQAEIDQNRQQWLSEFDTNKDGMLSLDEYKMLWLKEHNEMMVREFQFFDRDGNGEVTIEEYKGPLADIVADRDRNNDGSLGKDDRPTGDAAGERPRWRHLHGMMAPGMRAHAMGGDGPCMGGGGPGRDDGAPGDDPAAP